MKELRMRGYIRCAGAIMCIALLCFNAGEKMSYIRGLSKSITDEQLVLLREHMGGVLSMDEGESRQVSGDMSEALNEDKISVTMMGIPIKQMDCIRREGVILMPGGMPIGVSLYTDGVLVVGLGSVRDNEELCPAAEGGIKAGDVIVSVNGEQVTDSLQIC